LLQFLPFVQHLAQQHAVVEEDVAQQVFWSEMKEFFQNQNSGIFSESELFRKTRILVFSKSEF